jgi:mono/diheme cytochrome c family protein
MTTTQLRQIFVPFLALIIAAVMAIWLIPPAISLLKQAFPPRFDRSPTGFAAATIAQGARLFPEHCGGCHGIAGRGDGPAAKTLPIPPADLTAQHLWNHSDGELFRWLSRGMTSPQGDQAMPGFAKILSEADRWALIDFIRANNAGIAWAATGEWPHVLRAPNLSALCADGRTVTLADLQNKSTVIVALHPAGAALPVPPASLASQLTTIWLTLDPQVSPSANACVADDRSAWTAYAVISGVAPSALAGTVFLVDLKGWLRAGWRSDDSSSWFDPMDLSAKIEEIRSHPIETVPGE